VKTDTCVHYTGAINPRAGGVCAAGVNYRELVGGDVTGWVTRLPCCAGEVRGGGEKAACPHLRYPTSDELAEDKKRTDAHIAKFMVAFTGKVREWREANKWDRRNPKGATGKVPCDSCGIGEIYLSMASVNGHVHGKCTTLGCVSWME
jgi:nitrite reductase/ring-hydroxylating ferredoxin subunit